MTTGCRRARPSSCRISASSVRSFLRCGLRFGRGWRSEAGNDIRSARNATSSSGGAARASKASSFSNLAAGGSSRANPAARPSWSMNGIQRAVLAMGRAEVAQAEMRLGVEALLQCRDDARLADAGFARRPARSGRRPPWRAPSGAATDRFPRRGRPAGSAPIRVTPRTGSRRHSLPAPATGASARCRSWFRLRRDREQSNRLPISRRVAGLDRHRVRLRRHLQPCGHVRGRRRQSRGPGARRPRRDRR